MKSKKDGKPIKISDADRQQQVDRLIQASHRLINEINNELEANKENLTSFMGIYRVSSTPRSDSKIKEIKDGTLSFNELSTFEKAALIKKIFRTLNDDLRAPIFNYNQLIRLGAIQGQLDTAKKELESDPQALQIATEETKRAAIAARTEAIEEARAKLRAIRLTVKDENSPVIIAEIEKVKAAFNAPVVLPEEVKSTKIRTLEAAYNEEAREMLSLMPIVQREMVVHFFNHLNYISKKSDIQMPASNIGIAAGPSIFSDIPMDVLQQNTSIVNTVNKVSGYLVAHVEDWKPLSLKEKLQKGKLHDTIVQFGNELKDVNSLEALKEWVAEKTQSPEFKILMTVKTTPQDKQPPPGIIAFNKMVENKVQQLNKQAPEEKAQGPSNP